MGAAQGGNQAGGKPADKSAGAPSPEAEAQARIMALEQELAEARAAAGAPGASADAGGALLSVFEELLERVRAVPAQSKATFAPGESVESIAQGAMAKISIGQHSGEHLDAPVTFRARGADRPGGCNFNIVRRAQTRSVLETGETVFSQAVHYNFAPSGYFTTDDAQVAAHIRATPGYGVEVVEVGAESGDVPSPGPVLDKILQARIELDVAKLDEIEHAERGEEGWKRAVVLEAVAAARRSMQRAEQDLEVPA